MQAMKGRLAAALAFIALSIGFMPPAIAINVNSSSNQTVTITVASVDVISVSANPNLSLQLSGAAGTDTMGPVSDTSGRLNYSQNSPNSKKITASITATGVPTGGAANDINLTINVGAGPQGASTGTVILDNSGTLAANAQDVVTGIGKGMIANSTITYTASATLAATPQGSYSYTVTFTSV